MTAHLIDHSLAALDAGWDAAAAHCGYTADDPRYLAFKASAFDAFAAREETIAAIASSHGLLDGERVRKLRAVNAREIAARARALATRAA